MRTLLAMCLMIGSTMAQGGPPPCNDPWWKSETGKAFLVNNPGWCATTVLESSTSWTTGTNISACHKRATGFCQSMPLTAEEKDYDELQVELQTPFNGKSLQQFRAELRKLVEPDDPIMVPAVQEGTTTDALAPWLCTKLTEGHDVDLGTCRVNTVPAYHCVDGNRVLLHSDNSKLHVCLKLPVQESDNHASH